MSGCVERIQDTLPRALVDAGARHAQEELLGEPLEERVGPLLQVDDAAEVGEHEVAVELDERVEVEEHRHHARQEHDVQGEEVEEAGVGSQPDQREQAGDRGLHIHPGQGDRDAVPAAVELPRGVGIDSPPA